MNDVKDNTKSGENKTAQRDNLRFSVRPVDLLFFVVMAGLNVVGRSLAASLKLPFFLDMVGTLTSAVCLGPLAGAVTGAMTNIFLTLFLGEKLNYLGVSVGVGLFVGFLLRLGRKWNPYRVVVTGVLSGVLATFLSLPLNMVYCGGATGNRWGDALIEMLSGTIRIPVVCSLLGEAFVDVPDKTISILISVGLILLARRLSGQRQVKASLIGVMVCFATGCLLYPYPAEAADYSSEYVAITYGTDDGLSSTEINSLAQTTDGYLWAGAYSGLYRYDGHSFQKIQVDSRIANVTRMYADTKGILWVGTNDSGLFRYDTASGKTSRYSTKEGLPANAVRSIAGDREGNIYVGTVGAFSMISSSGELTVYNTGKMSTISGVRSVCVTDDGVVAGISGSGILFFMKEGRLLASNSIPEEEGIVYGAVATDGKRFLAGTSGNKALKLTLNAKGEVESTGEVDFGNISYFNSITYDRQAGGYFYCCENGLGFLDKKSEKNTQLIQDDFNSAVSEVITDYQGDVWFASNKQGVIKFAWNPFEDIFTKVGIEPQVVNSTLISKGKILVGMDDGLAVISLAKMKELHPRYQTAFEGVRIRHLMEDRRGHIWVSSYGSGGLVEILPGGDMIQYNENSAHTRGNLFRLAIELSDGRILAASTVGLNFIKDGKVEKTLSAENGLASSQILSMVEASDGSVLVGSDGDGIFVIKGDKVVKRIGEQDGLGSLVILKIVPCREGYLYVTSNALYYDDGKHIRKLDQFPYSNNYDVFITRDEQVWISSSAGMFILKLEDLLTNKAGYSYTLLNHSRGFFSTLTANAKNAVHGDDLYLCCTDGVYRISVEDYNSCNNDYNIKISSFMINDKAVPQRRGAYVIPASVGRIEIDVAVLNYTMSNPLIHMYLEGTDDAGITCFQHELTPLYFTNLPHGEYVLHVEILDESDSSVLREEQFAVVKHALLYETLGFKIYLLAVCVLLVLFVIWVLTHLFRNAATMKGLMKEVSTDRMTGLLNKASSEERIRAACLKGTGTLMMIDLDSFKLVNDLFGHDMGDRILIRFSDLIKDQIKEGDLAGRMGGDEFIAYLKESVSESAVAKFAHYLNEEILRSAREYMGENMNIPLGTSIGAVMVPKDGTDYAELFRKADKALYNVKQNGKHGYAVYHDVNDREQSEVAETMALSGIRMILGERNEKDGAFLLDFEKLQTVYRLFVRLVKRHPMDILLAQITMEGRNGDRRVSGDAAERFCDLLVSSLRQSDIVAQTADNQFLVLLVDVDEVDKGDVAIKRVLGKWDQTPDEKDYRIQWDYGALSESVAP